MYRKRWISDTEYLIQQYAGGRWRQSSEESAGFVRWLAEGNTPEEIAYVPPETPVPPTLDELKRQKRDTIAAARYEQETGGVTVAGVTVRTDRESQALITGAALKAMQDAEYVCRWKTVGGFVELNALQILGVADAVREHVQSCFDREAELLVDVEGAQTPEDLELIAW